MGWRIPQKSTKHAQPITWMVQNKNKQPHYIKRVTQTKIKTFAFYITDATEHNKTCALYETEKKDHNTTRDFIQQIIQNTIKTRALL